MWLVCLTHAEILAAPMRAHALQMPIALVSTVGEAARRRHNPLDLI